jgi:hypothetical protein
VNRRDFLTSSVVAAASVETLLTAPRSEAQEPAVSPREFYELRFYHLRRGPKTDLFDRFYRQAAIPALNRAGIDRVGVFNVAVGSDSPGLYVLLAHKSIESVATTPDRLLADPDYQQAGAEFLNATAGDPAYVRMESSLMAAFPAMPKLETPSFASGGKSRLFELRTYESHSKKANKKKIEMFGQGEIAIFRRCGLRPVFFGETLIGPRLPCLTYMLAFENQAAHDQGWGNFSADPEWKKLRAMPGYTDPEIVSNISNAFLRPAAYSQI